MRGIHPSVAIWEDGEVFIGEEVSIDAGVIIRPEMGKIVIHNHVTVGAYGILHGKGGIEIGQDTMLSPNVQIYAQNHMFSLYDIPIHLQPNMGHGVFILDDCWVGANSIILDNVTLGVGCVVGAGSVVTKSWPMGSVIAGNPAKFLKNRFYEDKWVFATAERAHPEFTPNAYLRAVRERYRWSQAYIPKDSLVLEIGCGYGGILEYSDNSVPYHYHGVDYDKGVIDYCKVKYLVQLPYLKDFRQANTTALPFGANHFDVILAFEVFEHLMPYQLERTLKEIHRVGKSYAVVVGSTPIVNEGHKPNTRSHINEMTEAQFTTSIKKYGGFRNLKRYGDYFVMEVEK